MTSHKRGVLTIISGFSGSGKGTVVKKMLEQHADTFRLSVSVTTRSPRDNEENAIHYFFISREKFDQMVEEERLLEYAEYVGDFYGTPREYVEEQLARGFDVLLEIEQVGAFKVKKAMPEAVLIFLTAPSVTELAARLRKRGESEDFMQARLAKAAQESLYIDRYDYIVINDSADRCAEEICGIIERERARVIYNEEFIGSLQKQLEPYRKEDI